ncbi:MAG: hypothetical protein ACK2UJ_04015 [Candidatus Promineifilaceae bacterium]|jgi:uncharacterized protein YpmB
MGLTEIIIFLAILFLIALILTPIYFYLQREKYVNEPEEESKESSEQ